MKIVLHTAYMDDLFSLGVSVLTRYPVSHASIYQDGKLWDTTIRRGHFDENQHVEGPELERTVMVFDFPEIDANDFIQRNLGRKYDLIGIVLWPIRVHSRSKMYCFEVASELLREHGLDVMPKNTQVTGRMLFRYFTDVLGLVGKVGNTRQLIQGKLD